MPASEGTSSLLAAAQAGDERALEKLWHAVFPFVQRVAARRMAGHRDRAWDAEDIAAAATASLLLRIRDGRLPNLVHRDELYRLLRVIVQRKCCNAARQAMSQRRGAGRVLPATVAEKKPAPRLWPVA